MADPKDVSTPDQTETPTHTGPERRSEHNRRRTPTSQPPLGQAERRKWIRRKADRLALERGARTDMGARGRLHRRIRIEVPVICRLVGPGSSPGEPARRALTYDLAPGGMGLILEEQFPSGTTMEALIRFGGDLMPADIEVVRVVPVGTKFLHNCRFTRLGTSDRNWLIEYLHHQDTPPA